MGEKQNHKTHAEDGTVIISYCVTVEEWGKRHSWRIASISKYF